MQYVYNFLILGKFFICKLVKKWYLLETSKLVLKWKFLWLQEVVVEMVFVGNVKIGIKMEFLCCAKLWIYFCVFENAIILSFCQCWANSNIPKKSIIQNWKFCSWWWEGIPVVTGSKGFLLWFWNLSTFFFPMWSKLKQQHQK